MKKTKTIIKKTKESKSPKVSDVRSTGVKTKQKQKQSVNVNVHIDQSKKTTPRTPKLKPNSAVGATTTLPHGENYIRPNPYFQMPPPVIYQQPQAQIYGQQPQIQPYGNLQPVNNISDSMYRAIKNEQEYEALAPRNNYRNDNMQYPMYSQTYNYNSMGLTNNEQNIKDEIKSKTALLDVFLKQNRNNAGFINDLKAAEAPTDVDVDNYEDENEQPVQLNKDDREYDIDELEDEFKATKKQFRDILGESATPVKEQEYGKNEAPAPAPAPNDKDDNEDIVPMSAWALSTMKLAQLQDYAQRLKIPLEKDESSGVKGKGYKKVKSIKILATEIYNKLHPQQGI